MSPFWEPERTGTSEHEGDIRSFCDREERWTAHTRLCTRLMPGRQRTLVERQYDFRVDTFSGSRSPTESLVTTHDGAVYAFWLRGPDRRRPAYRSSWRLSARGAGPPADPDQWRQYPAWPGQSGIS